MKLLLAFLMLTTLPAVADTTDCERSALAVQWAAADQDAKVRMLNNDEVEYEIVAIEDIEDGYLIGELELVEPAVLAQVSTQNIEAELDSMEAIFTIGEPSLLPNIEVYKIDGRIVAIKTSLFQDGGDTFDDTAPPKKHYDTAEEAEAAGLDTGADVSWQVHSYFEFDGRTLSPLKYDIYDEGGFRWSGY